MQTTKQTVSCWGRLSKSGPIQFQPIQRVETFQGESPFWLTVQNPWFHPLSSVFPYFCLCLFQSQTTGKAWPTQLLLQSSTCTSVSQSFSVSALSALSDSLVVFQLIHNVESASHLSVKELTLIGSFSMANECTWRDAAEMTNGYPNMSDASSSYLWHYSRKSSPVWHICKIQSPHSYICFLFSF